MDSTKHNQESLVSDEVAVIMVPFPAQGHLNQLLQFSCLISSYGLQVHFLSSATHNLQARTRANGLNPSEISKIHFHDLPTPDLPSPSPDPNTSHKTPEHIMPAWEATLAHREPVCAILTDLSIKFRRIIIIHDANVPYVVQDAATIQNAETFAYYCVSAFFMFFFKREAIGKPSNFDAIPEGLTLPSTEEMATEKVMKFLASQGKYLNFQNGVIYNTSRLIEGTYLDLLAREKLSENKQLWAVGPLLPTKPSTSSQNSTQQKCLEWLDKQEPNSVIYVSFGTTTSMPDEEVKELAIGLEQSKSKFIWVLRDADKNDIFDGKIRKIALPEGFEERVKEYGIIVRDWAPQPEILRHKATGGFMSHCGWNSCIESITMGVPIAAWPIHSDQPWNVILVTEILKVGVVVREWSRRNEPVSSSAIAESVRMLMASQDGDEIRKRAEMMGDAVRRSKEDGGVARLEMDSFVAHITR